MVYFFMSKNSNDFKNFASKWNAKPHTELSEEQLAELDNRTPQEKKNAKKFQEKAFSAVKAIIDSQQGFI